MAVPKPSLCRHRGRVLCSAPRILATAKTFTHTGRNKYCLAGSTAPVADYGSSLLLLAEGAWGGGCPPPCRLGDW